MSQFDHTIVGAGCSVFGAGLADDVLMNLVPFVLIVTSAQKKKEERNDQFIKQKLQAEDRMRFSILTDRTLNLGV